MYEKNPQAYSLVFIAYITSSFLQFYKLTTLSWKEKQTPQAQIAMNMIAETSLFNVWHIHHKPGFSETFLSLVKYKGLFMYLF